MGTGLIPLGGSLQAAAAWLSTTWVHDVAAQSQWMWATLETLHCLGLGLLGGNDRRARPAVAGIGETAAAGAVRAD